MGLCSTGYLFSVTVFTNLCIVSGYPGEFSLFVFSDNMSEEPLRLFTECVCCSLVDPTQSVLTPG